MSFNENNDFYGFNEDPAADFLERERRDLSDLGINENEFQTTTNSNIPASQYEALSELTEQINEPEKTRRWKEEFAARITKKDADEEIKRKDMREQAKKELDDFYKQRSEQVQRRYEENRQSNQTLENDLALNSAPSNFSTGKSIDWDKITSLCEFNPKTNRSPKDLTRYRSILLQLKQQQVSIK